MKTPVDQFPIPFFPAEVRYPTDKLAVKPLVLACRDYPIARNVAVRQIILKQIPDHTSHSWLNDIPMKNNMISP
jgi:hypothetical protein